MAEPTSSGRPTGPIPPTPQETGSTLRISQLGRYRILRKIGVGGSAMVYLALDTTIDKKVALKVLHEHLRDDPVTVRRFTNDARALARLNHPNIVQIYAAELDQYYFAMEHVEGVDLAKLIAEHGSLAPARAVAIALQMADALAHIHRQGLVHRDVKPGNVLIAPGDRVKMTDFSIAREAEETMLTLKGSLVGTVEYMAPEQIREEETDARVDVYAVGAVLHEMLAGRPPFGRESGASDLWPLMEKILKETPRPLLEIDPSISEGVSNLVRKALEKDPKIRFADMDEFIVALRACQETVATMLVTPVALAKPIELSDGTVRLSWTVAQAAEFDRYEIHASPEKDFVPSDKTTIETVRDQNQTETTFSVPAKSGNYYYRIKTVIRGGMAALSNRAVIEFGWKPPVWRRREFQWAGAAAILILTAAGGIAYLSGQTAMPGTGAAVPDTVRAVLENGFQVKATGRFFGAQFYAATSRYRFMLNRPTIEAMDTSPQAESLKGRAIPRVTVEIAGNLVAQLFAEGLDITLLPQQTVTVVGTMVEDPRQGLIIQPAERRHLQFENTAPAVLDVAPSDWKDHENRIVRLSGRVQGVDVRDGSNVAILTLEEKINVFMSSAVKNGVEGRGIDIPGLKQKQVQVIGTVKNDQRFGWELILNNPNHLTIR